MAYHTGHAETCGNDRGATNDTVWRTAKEKVLKPGVSWTFELLKETLKALAKQQLARIGLPGFDQ